MSDAEGVRFRKLEQQYMLGWTGQVNVEKLPDLFPWRAERPMLCRELYGDLHHSSFLKQEAISHLQAHTLC